VTIIADAMARETIARIADNIEIRGHFQGRGCTPDRQDPKQPCCVIANPAYPEGSPIEHHVDRILMNELGRSDLVDWNDKTPTDIVLSELRRIAAAR
jgi:hypothetical protein